MLIMDTPNEPAPGTPEYGAWYAEVGAWYEKWGATGKLDGGHQLQGVETAKTVRSTGVTDGPFIETKEVLGGFSAIEADSIEGPSRSPRPGRASTVAGSRSRYARSSRWVKPSAAWAKRDRPRVSSSRSAGLAASASARSLACFASSSRPSAASRPARSAWNRW